jgi:sugar lactone lactonase YvrE
VAVAPYTLGTFKGAAPSGLTSPDDIAVSADGADLWVGYGNGAATDGSGTKTSNVVEYNIATGAVVQNITEPVPGHIDGLKIDPATGEVWTNINEDANPKVVIINPKNGMATTFTPTSSLITGGLDDVVISGNDSAFVTASSQVDTTTPVIVEIFLKEKKKKSSDSVTSVLPGAPATVFNVVTNKAETGDTIGDPDSMTIDPAGELVLNDRSSDSLFIVRNPTATNPVLRVPLALVTAPDVPLQVDDTIFTYSLTSGASSTAGTIFITDPTANVIYTLTKPYFPSNEVYSAANVLNEVGLVDLNTGLFAPVATGFMGVHGLAFSPTSVAIP